MAKKLVDARREIRVDHKIYIDGLKITSLAQFFADELAKIPEDKREDAYLDIDCYSNYDSPSYDVSIVYSRLETWDEVEKRLAQEKVWAERRIAEAKKVLGIE